jgi:hypothetical protein
MYRRIKDIEQVNAELVKMQKRPLAQKGAVNTAAVRPRHVKYSI